MHEEHEERHSSVHEQMAWGRNALWENDRPFNIDRALFVSWPLLSALVSGHLASQQA